MYLVYLLILLLLILLLILLLYRQEIREIRKQIEFLSDNQSNKELTSSLRFRELRELQSLLNKLIRQRKEERENFLRRDHELKETISNISHDIRTPLTSLAGYFQLLERSSDPRQSKKYNAIIEARITELRDLLENFFDYIKLEDERYHLVEEELELIALLKTSILSFNKKFEEAAIQLKLKLPTEEILLRANYMAFQRIFNNLIENAIYHGQSLLEIEAQDLGSKLKIIFKNDFPDVGELEIENVFNRFYKADRARSANSSGLGLTIVKSLTEKMGGEVKAESEENCFILTLEFKK
ncbi:MAG: HAMP domain-containing sensor histidine kinase [Eubacteriales bacterium]|nr:HAMP domain-containing sensor histidine kinase [Eubacteriales bacterium]